MKKHIFISNKYFGGIWHNLLSNMRVMLSELLATYGIVDHNTPISNNLTKSLFTV